jgi:hypothetical protein
MGPKHRRELQRFLKALQIMPTGGMTYGSVSRPDPNRNQRFIKPETP